MATSMAGTIHKNCKAIQLVWPIIQALFYVPWQTYAYIQIISTSCTKEQSVQQPCMPGLKSVLCHHVTVSIIIMLLTLGLCII